ncbi:MAG: c-type cytochrome [Gammaproteobacteria bacterium]|nr:c-type cytochrome [Gammaproteobacteria bacterium]
MTRRFAACCLVGLLLAGCGRSGEQAAVSPPPVDPARTEADRARTLEQWSRSCVLCHADGTGGAPRTGQPEEWAPRLAQGMEVLLEHSIEGYRNMPPLGYCMDCTRDDFRALIVFMTNPEARR